MHLKKTAQVALAVLGLVSVGHAADKPIEQVREEKIRVRVDEKLLKCVVTTKRDHGGYWPDPYIVRTIALRLQEKLPAVELDHHVVRNQNMFQHDCAPAKQLIELAKDSNGTLPATLKVISTDEGESGLYETVEIRLPLGIKLTNSRYGKK